MLDILEGYLTQDWGKLMEQLRWRVDRAAPIAVYIFSRVKNLSAKGYSALYSEKEEDYEVVTL